MDKKKADRFKGTNVLVVGLARTGIAAARFLSELGCRITISERRGIKEAEDALQEIKDVDVQLEFGGHKEGTFLDKDWILVSPGIPMNIPPLEKARAKGIPVLSDIELAFQITSVPILAITGTNGKTTTTALLGEIFSNAGKGVFVGGNIGTPILNAFEQDQGFEFFVIEVSSFQLEGVKDFAPHIAVILNLTPDHLDRYSSMAEYQEAKARILKAQTRLDYAILNAQDPWLCNMADVGKADTYFFDNKQPVSRGAGLRGGDIIIQDRGKQINIGPARQMGLKGVHNLDNMMAACLAAYLSGISEDVIMGTLKDFKGLPHRLEKVRELNGIQFINDSKGTNIGAVIKAIESIDTPVILIAGGRNKGGDFGLLAQWIKEKTKAVFLIGEARAEIANSLKNYTEVNESEDLRSAVIGAYRKAKPGDTVLLSPGCASFDMFKDYCDRGEKFKRIVMEIDDAEQKKF